MFGLGEHVMRKIYWKIWEGPQNGRLTKKKQEDEEDKKNSTRDPILILFCIHEFGFFFYKNKTIFIHSN